ncbi:MULTISPECIES: hypothetical protein [Metabacillus]|uniref:hypothetical protein n=1 Tax=Metabacillus TaxID=2675233 RepID=UPI000C7FFE19|nr:MULTISPECIES: hypothetical protein [Metabacillus]MCM3443617.1 hypothetical protein [Metabacillus halosaccharovorans]PMC34225.1 hypothetical protein CJ195_24205 [Bacillus sp. UMB0899]
MNRGVIIFCLTILLGIVGYLAWNVYGHQEMELIDLVKAEKRVKSDIQTVTDEENKVYKWLSSTDLDTGHLDGHDQDVVDHYREKKGVVEFLFASVLMKDAELFIQAYLPQVISDDLFKVDNGDKIEVTLDIINKISRNGTLKEIGYESEKGVFGTDTQTAKVKLIYTDELEVTLSLDFKMSGTQHEDGHSGDIYSITTSAWDIIDAINKAENNKK